MKTTGHPVNLNFPSRSDRASKIELWALATWRFEKLRCLRQLLKVEWIWCQLWKLKVEVNYRKLNDSPIPFSQSLRWVRVSFGPVTCQQQPDATKMKGSSWWIGFVVLGFWVKLIVLGFEYFFTIGLYHFFCLLFMWISFCFITCCQNNTQTEHLGRFGIFLETFHKNPRIFSGSMQPQKIWQRFQTTAAMMDRKIRLPSLRKQRLVSDAKCCYYILKRCFKRKAILIHSWNEPYSFTPPRGSEKTETFASWCFDLFDFFVPDIFCFFGERTTVNCQLFGAFHTTSRVFSRTLRNSPRRSMDRGSGLAVLCHGQRQRVEIGEKMVAP